jgi:hypothetical protein
MPVAAKKPSKKVMKALAEKLHPKRFRTGAQFHAMLACMLGQTGWVTPEYAALTVTCDGFLLGMHKGDCGFNDFIGSRDDLIRNLNGTAAHVGLDPDETAALLALAPEFNL